MNLAKELYFGGVNQITTQYEITTLANDLLNTTFDVNGRTIKLSVLGWKFEFNSRRRAMGLCSKRRKTIYISLWLLKQNLNKSAEFENTLRHELAHAIDMEFRGTSDHSYKWKSIARQVLCSGERCFKSENIKITEETKYTLICDNCGREAKKHRKPKRKIACGKCCEEHANGKYDERFAFKVITNY